MNNLNIIAMADIKHLNSLQDFQQAKRLLNYYISNRNTFLQTTMCSYMEVALKTNFSFISDIEMSFEIYTTKELEDTLSAILFGFQDIRKYLDRYTEENYNNVITDFDLEGNCLELIGYNYPYQIEDSNDEYGNTVAYHFTITPRTFFVAKLPHRIEDSKIKEAERKAEERKAKEEAKKEQENTQPVIEEGENKEPVIKESNSELPKASPQNQEVHNKIKQLMMQKKQLSVQLDINNKLMVSCYPITGLEYQLTENGWFWLLNYLKDGDYEDFEVNPTGVLAGDLFIEEEKKALIEVDNNIQMIPFLRETQAKLRLIGLFPYGRLHFEMHRNEEILIELTRKQQNGENAD